MDTPACFLCDHLWGIYVSYIYVVCFLCLYFRPPFFPSSGNPYWQTNKYYSLSFLWIRRAATISSNAQNKPFFPLHIVGEGRKSIITHERQSGRGTMCTQNAPWQLWTYTVPVSESFICHFRILYSRGSSCRLESLYSHLGSSQKSSRRKDTHQPPQGLLFAAGRVRMGASKQQHVCISGHTELGLRFLTQEQSSGFLKHPNISGCHCSPRDSAALVNPCCSVGAGRGKPHQMCRQNLHNWRIMAAKFNALGEVKALGLTKITAFPQKNLVPCLYCREITHRLMELREHRAWSG